MGGQLRPMGEERQPLARSRDRLELLAARLRQPQRGDDDDQIGDEGESADSFRERLDAHSEVAARAAWS